MSGSRPNVNIRVSTEGADETRRKIEAIGPAGEAAMRRLSTASAAAGPEMQKLATASDVAQRSFVGMGGSLGRIGGVFTGVSGVAATATAGFLALGAAASVGAVQIAKAGDAANAVMARLTSAAGGLGQAQAVYQSLFALSQQTGVAVAESAGSFARFSVAAKEIGATSDQVLRLTAGLQKAGIVAGASGEETTAAVQQIGQALASGKLQGDELRSLLENMPQFAQALARELGVGIGQLRQMGSEGKLTADVIFPAMLRASEKMSAEFDKMPVTMSRAKDILVAATEDFGVRLDRITGLSKIFAGFMQQGAAALNAAGRYIAPNEAEAADQGVAAAERRAAQVRAQVAAERAASAYGDISPGLKQAEEIAQQELSAALQAQSEIRAAAIERDRANETLAAQQARDAARVTATIRLKDTAADLDARFKARQAYADKIKKLDEDEIKGGTLPDGVTFDGLRTAAAKELAEALEKVAGGHAKIAKEAKEADDHVKEYMKSQEKAAEAVAAAQKKAAEEIERFHSRSFDAVANIGERAMDRLGDAIVNAFASGNGAAVNFGNIARSILASVAADVAKLAVVNPILNSLFTSSSGPRPTLSGAFGGSATSIGGGGFSIPGLGSLFGEGGIGGALGLTGPGGFMSTPLWGGSVAGPTTAAGIAASGAPTLGSLLGGAGAGFGAGMFLNNILGGNQVGGTVGSGVGALGGALIGSIIPGIGTLIGGLIGGAAGGGLGGLIGPGKTVNSYGLRLQSSGFVENGANDFAGSLTPVSRQYYDDAGKALFDQADQVVAAVNAYLSANNLQVAGASIIGGNKNGPDGSGFGTVGEAFGNLAFRSTDNAGLSAYLATQSFDDPAKLQAAVDGFKAADAAIKALGVETVPAFTASLKAVNDNFDAGVEAAKKYGLAEDNLTTARAKAIDALEAQRTETLRQSDVALSIRRLAAGGDTQQAELARQAEQARLELDAFGKSLDALAISAEDKGARLVALEEVQAAERAAIISRYGEQAATALRQAGGNIRAYLDSLATGSAAGASPTDRLAAAQAAFERDRALGMGGDRDALGRITGSADALLSAGRNVYASGGGYQSILGQVKNQLGALPVVQSYDAMQAASLAAIQAALNGTLSTSTVILPAGNVVQIAGGFSLGDVPATLHAINAGGVARHETLIQAAGLLGWVFDSLAESRKVAVAQHATAINSEGALYALGLIGNATNDNLALANRIATDASAAIGRHLALGNTNNSAGFVAAVTAIVDVNTSLATVHRSAVDVNTSLGTLAFNNNAGFAAANRIAADAAAASSSSLASLNTHATAGLGAITTSIGSLNTNTTASLAAANTIAANNTTYTFQAIGAGNTIAADTNVRLADIASVLRATLAEVATLRTQVATLNASVQQGATLTATEARAAGVRVAARVGDVDDTLRRNAA